VNVHFASDNNGTVSTGASNDTPDIRKTMMLKTASGINSSGKPILDIGETFFSRKNLRAGIRANQDGAALRHRYAIPDIR
jgi:hypothetical protein